MSLNIPINKILLIISTLIISSIIFTSFFSYNLFYYKERIIENYDIKNIKEIFEDIIKQAYFSTENRYIKILNIGNNFINISFYKKFNLTILIFNETFNFEINYFLIKFNKEKNNNYSLEQLYTKNNEVINTYFDWKSWEILPKLNIQSNFTRINGRINYNIYLSFLNLNKESFLKGTFELRTILNKTYEKIVRAILFNSEIKILLDNNEILNMQVNRGDIVTLYISKINLDFLIVNYG
jgi:hypothetical protein